ncbi:aldolase [Macrolepiota fuliginosa MF-IS2]|uniref:fructose-bisphosphate aldolase n=1 Tax=Macrolepiota fuliginosa MF-IS2 TaxID=1400762 RepID=A0A9P5XS62_9AGAR|nr:aldolase [Macrolepiota fuliginosa MF-IS2]
MPDSKVESVPPNLFAVPDLTSELPPLHLDVFLQPYWSPHVAHELITTANSLVNPRGKGIYATDESPNVMQALFDGVPLNNHEERVWSEAENRERRKKWRECAYKAVPSEYISGVILYAETLIDFGLGPILADKGVIPGVRANGELMPIPSSPSEFIVEGLDGLLGRLQAARAAGARFSKWRVPIACTSKERGLPTQTALELQAETLGRYAAMSQKAGLVPIVEPDVEFSEDADLARSVEVHEKAITLIYERMKAYNVLLEGSIIKPSFPQPGLKNQNRGQYKPEDIALATATVIARSVPGSVPGVAFLSGGLPPALATHYLAALNALINSSKPPSLFSRLPPLTFSFGRALQGDALKEWVKGNENETRSLLQKWSKVCWQSACGVVPS